MGCGGKQKEREFIRFAFRVPCFVFCVLRSALRCERLAYAYTISRTPNVMV